jgi:transposase
MDMSGAYLSTVRRALGPDANERIVFDKYHLASLLGNAVNTVRRDEHKALLGATRRASHGHAASLPHEP